ncbi:membrane alanyl aminopeptidase [Wyeomyia smithii]|uniref:membrane alanyl aminopeptidase n=1 Tax=Wyeomyia smithii TaxID=174621 RepID=UPI002467E9E1|nr:membrane alanyl aminopeptidase [Wyeomyia smithii]XP_055523954.1 membrane alanyl aminopeptidase [Wyeomyia smithii]
MNGALLCSFAAATICGVLSNPVDLFQPAVFAETPRAELADYRLNEDVWPSHYDVELTPYFEDEAEHAAFTFDGTVTIKLKPSKAGVTKIDLHVARINKTSLTLNNAANNVVVPIEETIYNEETEILTIPVSGALDETDYLLKISYIGELADDMHGFYRSYYKVGGKNVWLATTQFQTTSARRAFPCFDEPKFKATFQIRINQPNSYNSFSNTAILSENQLPNGRTQVTFEMTPIMSTYLVAFIVAQYEENFENGIGILARPEAKNQTDYSLQVGIKLLKELGSWIDYPYNSVPEMTRMYMAAVPDFSAGAMENWGLLTYRETNILYRSDDSTSLQQQRIAAVISHEIAHQWFGDLVTCEWWDVTWLNEGFARYFQYFGTALVEQSWNLDYQFVVEQLQGVMQMDSLESTHPMTHNVYTQAQVSNIFDNISYNKGAVVLRMVEHAITTEKFQNALREYIKERQFKTSRPENLFSALNLHGKADISTFMKPWTTQSGYPLVTVTGSDDGFTINQRRFLLNNMSHDDPTLWPLPITYATKEEDFENTMPTVVDTSEYKITITNVTQLPYFILNNQQVGYYRVNYDTANWDKISTALRSENFGGIHVLNRAQIVDDLFNLARAGEVKYESALDILDYLQDETEYPPWLSAVNGLTILSRRIHPEDEELFAQYVIQLFSKVYNMVKFEAPAEAESRLITYLRINVLQWACNYGHSECKRAAVEEFNRYFNNTAEKVHPDLRQIVYCEGVRQGTEEHFDFLWNQYLTTNMATEQILILQGLGCVQEKEQIFKLMDAISSDDIRSQDKSTAFSYLLANPYTIDHLSEYLRMYYVRWAEAHGSYMNVASALNNLLARMKSNEQMWAVRSFAERNEKVFGVNAYNSIIQGIEDFQANQEFVEKNRVAIRNFLEEKTRSSGTGITAVGLTILLSAIIALLN